VRFYREELCLEKCVRLGQDSERNLHEYTWSVVPLAVTYIKTFGVDPLATFAISIGLARRNTREPMLADSLQWTNVWAAKLTPEQVGWLLAKFEAEVGLHEDAESFEFDHDLAYLVDPVKRVLSGQIFETGECDLTRRARSLIERAAAIYPAVSNYTPNPGQAPLPEEVIREISAREAAVHPPEEVPF
jgi:hypothetical protein